MKSLHDSWAVLLRTRKRNGSWVDTPVNFALEGERGYFGTPADSAKVKRLRNFDRVELAPCTLRGKPTGPAIEVRVRRLEGEESAAARAALLRRHPIVHRFLVPLELRIKGCEEIRYEVSFEPSLLGGGDE